MRDGYDPHHYVRESPALGRVIDALASDRFSGGTAGVFGPLLRHLFEEGDPYCVLADFEAYRATQERVGNDYLDREAWARPPGTNISRMGSFSSDRAISEYATRIWRLDAPRKRTGPT